MRNVTIILAVVAVLAMAVPAQAALTIYEPFNRPIRNLSGSASLGGDIGFGTGTYPNWATYYESIQISVEDTGLAYPAGSPLTGLGRSILTSSAIGNTRNVRNLVSHVSMATDNTFYMSALFKYDAAIPGSVTR